MAGARSAELPPTFLGPQGKGAPMNRWVIPSVLAVSLAVGTMAILVLLLAWRLRGSSSPAPHSVRLD